MISQAQTRHAAVPREGSALPNALRRGISVPLVFGGAALALGTAPLWLPLAAAVDLLRQPRTALRCGLFFAYYLGCEALGLLAAAATWLATGAGLGGAAARARRARWAFTLQKLWAGALFHGPAWLFGFRLEVEDGEAVAATPLLLFLRHASVADTLLPAMLASRPHGIRLRYVLKRELLWDPCLDVVGHWLPNYFARRDSSDSESEREGVAALVRGLGPGEGVMIYPEGTRFSEARRERVLERLRGGGHAGLRRRAETLRRVLPPRLGGPLALLDASPGVDVVFGAHAGFDRVGSFWDLWDGALVGAVLRVRLWRVPAAEIPRGREARIDWLYEQWARVDRVVAELQQSGGPPS